jgi:uncharacterized BrkB/YihY/UPF0761 family membrane protein
MSFDETPEWYPNSSTVPNGTGFPADAEPSTSADRVALVALVISLMVLFSCVPLLNCLTPLAPLVAGIITLMQAKQAANPQRARTYGWIATSVGIIIVVVTVGFVVVYGAVVLSMMDEMQRQL